MNFRQSALVSGIVLASFLLGAGSALADLPPTYVQDLTSTSNLDTQYAVVDTVAGEARALPYVLTQTLLHTTHDIQDVAMLGDLAFLAEGVWGLEIVQGYSMGTVLTGFHEAGDIYLGVSAAGTRAYLANSYNGLKILDITNPASPSVLGSYDTPGNATDVVVAGDRAYLADGNSGIAIFDVSTASPILLGTHDTPGEAKKLALHGHLLYVADGTGGLRILDVTDPALISEVGSYPASSMVNDVAVAGPFAYLADNAAGLVVLSVTDPTTPQLMDTYDTPGLALAVTLDGDRALVADDLSGLQILDISNSTTLRLVESFESGARVRCVATRTTYAFIGGDMGLANMKLSGEDITLRHIATHDMSLDHMAIDGNLMLASEGDHVVLIDIANPEALMTYGQVTTPGSINDITVNGGLAYVADGTSGLTTLDIQDPSSATVTSSLSLSGSYARNVAVSGMYAFVAAGDTLYTMDVADAGLPAIVAKTGLPGAGRLCVDGNLLYAASQTVGLSIYDITSPGSGPTLIGTYAVANLLDIAVFNDQAFLALGQDGLESLDVSDPSAPTHLTTYLTDFINPIGLRRTGQYLVVRQTDTWTHDVGTRFCIIQYSTLLVGQEITTTDFKDAIVHGQDVLACTEWNGLQFFAFAQDDIESSTLKGRSINPTADHIVLVRPTVERSGHIVLSMEDDAGVFSNLGLEPAWTRLDTPSIDPVWWVIFDWDRHGYDAVLSSLTLDFRTTRPYVDTVTDIPGDQGRQVRLSWQRSGYDFSGGADPVTQYAVYRRYTAKADGAADLPTDLPSVVQADAETKAATGWEFVTTVPARTDDHYAVVVPTLADSTVTGGMAWSTFMVSALTATPGVFHDSPPDSGYSVDNLAPSVPAGFAVAPGGGGNELSWLESPDPDFRFFNIYRGTSPDFVPDASNRVQSLVGTSWTDADGSLGSYYKLTAVDFAGNESTAASEQSTTNVDEPDLPIRATLLKNTPNPFNPSTTIAYSVPEGSGRVRIDIHDVRGQIVALLVDGVVAPGIRETTWDGRDLEGQLVPSGTYFARMVIDGMHHTRKIMLLK